MSAPETSCRVPPILTLVHTSAALLATGSLAFVLWTGLEERGTALTFGVLIAVGELNRRSGPHVREAAPLGAAGALSYALLGESAGAPTHHGAAQVVTVVLAASSSAACRTSDADRAPPPTSSPVVS